LTKCFLSLSRWSFGTNRIQLKADLQSVEELATIIANDFVSFASPSASSSFTAINVLPRTLKVQIFLRSVEQYHVDVRFLANQSEGMSPSRAKEEHSIRKELLDILLRDEADRLKLWLNPTQDSKRGPILSTSSPSPDVSLSCLFLQRCEVD